MLEDGYYQKSWRNRKRPLKTGLSLSNKNLDTCRTYEVIKHDIEYVIAMLEKLGEDTKTGAMKMKLK